MKIGSIHKLSLSDYPGKLSALIGTQGCNMRCFWCHNSYLIPCDYTMDSQAIVEEEVLNFLAERDEFLDGVVITGGEPTIHPDLPLFCEKLKKMGFSIKLDTNGTNPNMLNMLINDDLVDYIAMDIKTDFKHYRKLLKEASDAMEIMDSINLLLAGNKPYEFRTTCVSPFVDLGNIEEIGAMIEGAQQLFLQECIKQKNVNGNKQYQIIDEKDLSELAKRVTPYVVNCEIR